MNVVSVMTIRWVSVAFDDLKPVKMETVCPTVLRGAVCCLKVTKNALRGI